MHGDDKGEQVGMRMAPVTTMIIQDALNLGSPLRLRLGIRTSKRVTVRLARYIPHFSYPSIPSKGGMRIKHQKFSSLRIGDEIPGRKS